MTPEKVLSFWLDETDPKQWYNSPKSLDNAILQEFYPTWVSIMDGKFGMWLTYPSGSLAYILVLDQFTRNMFRGTSKAFSSDLVALAAAKQAIKHKFDLAIDEPGRQFFYLPLMHLDEKRNLLVYLLLKVSIYRLESLQLALWRRFPLHFRHEILDHS